MKKSIKIIGIVVIIIIVLITLACFWVIGLKEDQKKTKVKMKEVTDNYPAFNKEVDNFSSLRNKLYEKKEDMYYETLSQQAKDWDKFMEEYAEQIKKVENASKKLKQNCKIKYGDVGTNSKCTAFKANYEAAQNYYISDVKMYNELIDKYDKWTKEQGGQYNTLKKAELSVYKKYIDFDNDGEYFGKEEVKKDE